MGPRALGALAGIGGTPFVAARSGGTAACRRFLLLALCPLALAALALAFPGTAAGSLPTRGVFDREEPGQRQARRHEERCPPRWGRRHGVCRDCRLVTWYFNLKPFEPQGAAVVFRRGRVVRVYTVWRPRGWRTNEGLELGATTQALVKAYSGLASRSCDRYTAFTRRGDVRTTSVFYVYRGRLWAFGLMRPWLSPCPRPLGLAFPGDTQTESGREVEQRRQGVVPVGVAALAIDQESAHPERLGALDVVSDRVADHDGLRRVDLEHLEHAAKDGRARLHLSVRARRDPCIDVEGEVADEVIEVPARVRDQADLQAVLSELGQGGQRVLVQLEVLRVLPALGDLLRDRSDLVSLAPMPRTMSSVKRTQISSSWSSSGWCSRSRTAASRASPYLAGSSVSP